MDDDLAIPAVRGMAEASTTVSSANSSGIDEIAYLRQQQAELNKRLDELVGKRTRETADAAVGARSPVVVAPSGSPLAIPSSAKRRATLTAAGALIASNPTPPQPVFLPLVPVVTPNTAPSTTNAATAIRSMPVSSLEEAIADMGKVLTCDSNEVVRAFTCVVCVCERS